MADDIKKRIMELEARLKDLKKRLPSDKDRPTGLHVHADPVNMIMEIEELEDELDTLRNQLKQG